MHYNLKISFYGEEIQISRYGYRIYKTEEEKKIKNEDDTKYNQQSSWNSPSSSKDCKQTDLACERFNKIRSQRRSKQSIYELVRANTWDYFATFTFREDRYNYDICKEKLRKFFNNFKQRKANIEYVVVPEQHKDGAWHFHGLLQGELDDYLSTTWRAGRYELVGYKLGKCELEKVRDTCRVSSYITKYITKDLGTTLKGKRRYFYSKGLNRPCVRELLIDNEQSTVDFILSNFPDCYITHCRSSEFNDNRIDYIQLRKLEEFEKKRLTTE